MKRQFLRVSTFFLWIENNTQYTCVSSCLVYAPVLHYDFTLRFYNTFRNLIWSIPKVTLFKFHGMKKINRVTENYYNIICSSRQTNNDRLLDIQWCTRFVDVNISHYIFLIQFVCIWPCPAYRHNNIGERSRLLPRDTMLNCVCQHYGGTYYGDVEYHNACENMKKINSS